eukprot:8322470-Pyramimonas_sp.AAC.1
MVLALAKRVHDLLIERVQVGGGTSRAQDACRLADQPYREHLWHEEESLRRIYCVRNTPAPQCDGTVTLDQDEYISALIPIRQVDLVKTKAVELAGGQLRDLCLLPGSSGLRPARLAPRRIVR